MLKYNNVSPKDMNNSRAAEDGGNRLVHARRVATGERHAHTLLGPVEGTGQLIVRVQVAVYFPPLARPGRDVVEKVGIVAFAAAGRGGSTDPAFRAWGGGYCAVACAVVVR